MARSQGSWNKKEIAQKKEKKRKDKVIKKYKVEYIPEPQEPEPNEIDILKTEITELKQTIDIMLGGEVIE